MNLSKLTQDQWFKVIKAALYLGFATSLSAIISAITQSPDLFGPLTPIINIVLVFGKQLLTEG